MTKGELRCRRARNGTKPPKYLPRSEIPLASTERAAQILRIILVSASSIMNGGYKRSKEQRRRSGSVISRDGHLKTNEEDSEMPVSAVKLLKTENTGLAIQELTPHGLQ